MGSCPRTKEYMLNESMSREARQHLDLCETCRREVDSWQQVQNSISKWDPSHGRQVADSKRASQLVREARRRGETGGREPRRLAIATVSLAAGLAITMGIFWIVRTSDAENPVPTSSELVSFQIKEIFSRQTSISVGQDSFQKTLKTDDGGRLLVDLEGDQIGIGGLSHAVISKSASNEVRVALLKGTIAVNARKRSPAQSLVVEAGGTEVRVIGTKFSVELEKEKKVSVTVLEGTVRIISPSGDALNLLKGNTYEATGDKREVADMSPEDKNRIGLLLNPEDESEGSRVAEPIIQSDIPIDPQVASETHRHQPRDKPTIAMAKSLILEGKNKEAQAALKEILIRSPKNVEGWMLLATSWRKTGKWREAASAFDEAVLHGSAAESNRARFMSAVVYQDKLGDPKSAAKLLEQYLRASSGNRPLEPKALLRLVRAKVALGDLSGAEKAHQQLYSRYRGTKEALSAAELVDKQ